MGDIYIFFASNWAIGKNGEAVVKCEYLYKFPMLESGTCDSRKSRLKLAG